MTDGDYADVLDRREFLALTGATGAAALVGTAGPAGAQSEAGVYDVVHESVTTANPANVQFNPTNTSDQPEIAQDLLFERFARYNYDEAEYQPAAVESWTHVDESLVLQVRAGLTWSNGDAVTAEDVATQLRLAEYDGDPMWEWTERVEVVDEHDLIVHLARDVNPDLVERVVLDRWLQQDRATYGDLLADLESGDAEIADVRSFEDNDPVTNGPFTIVNRDDERLRASRFDAHPDADGINFAEWSFENFAGNQQRQQALLNLNVDSDYSLTVQSDTVADFPDAVEEVQIPDVFGLGLAPNFEDRYAGDRAIRQAIAYVVDRDRAVDNSYARVKEAPEVMTPISTQYQEDWLGDGMSDYETYGVDSAMTDEATSVLEDAGYTVSDGTVEDEDGNVVSIEISTPGGWGDWTLPLETLVQQLNDFGFDATLQNPEDYFTAITEDDFQFIANTWLHGGPTPYPYYSLTHALVEPQHHACHTNYPGYTDQYGGSEADRTVPARDGDGDVTLNPADELDALAEATGEDEIRERVRDLAWLANQDLPRIPLMEKRLQQWLTTDEWDVPDDVDEYAGANVQWAPTALVRQGDLQYDHTAEATVTVADAPSLLSRGESTTLTVAVARPPAVLEGLTVEVAVGDDSIALLPGADLADGVEGSVQTHSDRSTVTVDAMGIDDAEADSVPLATIRIAGKGIGETTVEPRVESVEKAAGESLTTTTQSASLIVDQGEVAPVDGEVPIDSDGDGRREDVNADGTANLADAGDLFQHRDDPAVTGDADAYDFSGNGEVDLADVVQLFQENT